MATLTVTWEGAYRSFLLHLSAINRADKTIRFYKVQLGQLIPWANAEGISLTAFRMHHLDSYLAWRREQGTSRMTMRHDAACAKKFTAWCKRYDYFDRDPLYEYEVTKPPTPHKYKPTLEEVQRLVCSVPDFWDKEINPGVAELSPAKRNFHRDRFYAILLLLIDGAFRYGEVLSLKVHNFRPDTNGTWKIEIEEAKGKEGRPIPLTAASTEAIREWLKVRKKTMEDVPADQDEGWLFMSESNTRVTDRNFYRSFVMYRDFAGLPKKLTPHGIRRFRAYPTIMISTRSIYSQR